MLSKNTDEDPILKLSSNFSIFEKDTNDFGFQ